MPADRKASIRELTGAAYELESGVMEGGLHRDPAGGGWMVGEHELNVWLERYAGQEVVVIVSSLDDDRPMPMKVCRTCGTEYTSFECPRCRLARTRLRGR